jgi:hypothetical protein
MLDYKKRHLEEKKGADPWYCEQCISSISHFTKCSKNP